MKIIFTRHAEYRLERRKILKEEVIDALKYPDKTLKNMNCIISKRDWIGEQ